MRAHDPAKTPDDATRQSGPRARGAPLPTTDVPVPGGRAMSPAAILTLQRSAGNAALTRLLRTVHLHDADCGRKQDATPPAQRSAVQRSINSDNPVHTENSGRAGVVSVTNIRGTPLPASANSPSVNPFGWNELHQAGHTLANPNGNNSHYNAVRMHLMNGRLGGPGNQTWNLAPGPATTNSSMSAGPETAAKEAVANGDRIWLETAVLYPSTPPNTNNFATVIPNRMKMEWGKMTAAGGRGPAQPPAWDEVIDQPVGALTSTQQTVYQNMPNETTLDSTLAGVSKQELIQAYSLVPAALRKHIILKYGAVYLGMDDTQRTAVLGALDADETNRLIGALNLGGAAGIVEHVMRLLYAAPTLLQAVFGTFGAAGQLQLAGLRRGEMLEYLGDRGTDLAKTNMDIFRLYPEPTRAAILDPLTGPQISSLVGSSQWHPIITSWLDQNGLDTQADRVKFIKAHLTETMSKSYQNNTLKYYSSARDVENSGNRRSTRIKQSDDMEE